MAFVQDVIAFLGQLGLWDVILPFILVFTITYAILERTKVLGAEDDGTPKHHFNAVASVVIGFIVLIAVDTLNVINLFSEMIVVLILVAICIAIIFGFFGFQEVHKKWYFMAIALLVFSIAALYVLGWLNYINWAVLRKYEGVVVGIIIFFIVLWAILRPGKKEEEEEEKKEKKKEEKKEEKKEAPKQKSELSYPDMDQFMKGLSEDARREIISGVMQHPAMASGKFTMKDLNEVIRQLSDETVKELIAAGRVK
ncbi:hypothetical protein KY310_04475 [Candidatus Woesearchaeota archaeon]|nr:hypothetical protein [Candidatus Woesearchaeota archaeon]